MLRPRPHITLYYPGLWTPPPSPPPPPRPEGLELQLWAWGGGGNDRQGLETAESDSHLPHHPTRSGATSGSASPSGRGRRAWTAPGARGPRGVTAAGRAAAACPPPADTATAPGQFSGPSAGEAGGPSPRPPCPISPVRPCFQADHRGQVLPGRETEAPLLQHRGEFPQDLKPGPSDTRKERHKSVSNEL